jgi:hypothetical protein
MSADTARPNHILPVGAPPVAPTNFPRSADDLSLTYMTSYRVDHKTTMRAFVDRVLTDLPADKAHLAHGIAYEAAKAELKRPLRTPEHRLLAEATRDWITAHETLQNHLAGFRR